MAKLSPAETKARVIDALVLALSHSGLRDLAGTDALRSVLAVEYHDMVRDKTFDLQQLWDLLEDQPGFDPAAAIAPMCAVKAWESRLELEVQMPRALSHMDSRQRSQAARECSVPPAEVSRIFRAGSSVNVPVRRRTTSRELPAAAEETTGTYSQRLSAQMASARAPSPARVKVSMVAGIVGAICLLFAGLTLYRHLNSGKDWAPLGAASFAGELPITDVHRLGNQVGATLVTDEWLNNTEKVKRQQLATALKKLRPSGVRVLFLRDSKQVVRASAQFFNPSISGVGGARGDPTRIDFAFPR